MVVPQTVRVQRDLNNLGRLFEHISEYDLDEILSNLRADIAHVVVVGDPVEFAAVVEVHRDRIHAREMDGKLKDYHNFIDFYCFFLANKFGKKIMSVCADETKKPNRWLIERLGYDYTGNNEFIKVIQ